MKKLLVLLGFLLLMHAGAQIAHYNQYPTMYVEEGININNASFAYSLRKIISGYSGPLVKLRRSSDDATMDFYADSSGKLNLTAVNAWAGSSSLYVDTWYDQSTALRNAVQPNTVKQPLLDLTNSQTPRIKFDGNNDFLTVNNGNLHSVTNGGKEATVLVVMETAKASQHTFGVLSGADRWSAHANWNENNFYFDPGHCCNAGRSFNNSSNQDVMSQYTLVAHSNSILVRSLQVDKNMSSTDGISCTRDWDFIIGAATTSLNNQGGFSKNSFIEFIMFPIDENASKYEPIESSQISFWGL